MAPFFDDFVLEPTPFNAERIMLEWRSRYDDAVMSVNQLSDGTLRFIALTTLFKQPHLPDVICIDEPELGLHPMAVNTLVDMAYEASLKHQVILATQSVPLVDAVQPSDILTVEQIRGATEIARPNEDALSARIRRGSSRTFSNTSLRRCCWFAQKKSVLTLMTRKLLPL